MGRSDTVHDADYPVEFEIERLEWVDGDYDQGGAYWGRTKGEYIYRAEGESADAVETMFVRAGSVSEAKARIIERYTNATFSVSSDVEIVAAAYLEAALWSTHNERQDDDFDNESENLLDSRYEPSEEMRLHFKAECELFVELARDLLAEAEDKHGYGLDMAGYDFWMTQSGSGVSFTDRDLGEVGDKLSEMVRASFEQDDLYVGDDDLIHSSNQWCTTQSPTVPAAG